MKKRLVTAAAIVALAAAGTAAAGGAGGWRSDARTADLEHGYSAQELIGMDVQGRGGESIGEVRNIVLSRDGRVAGVVISTGGILGLGETAYRLPWSHVDVDANGDDAHVGVPMTADEVALFRWDAEDVNTRAGEVLAASIIGGDLALQDGMRAGEIDDLVIGRDGRLDALIVSSDLNGDGDADHVFPFTGRVKFNSSADVYIADIGFDEARRLPRFDDHEPFDVDASAVGASGTAGASGEIGYNH